MPARKLPTPEECGQCGSPIPRGALACPECGADEETGWDANPYLPDEGDLDLPDYLTEDYDPARDGPVLPDATWASGASRWRILAAVLALLLLLLFAFALS